MCASIMATVLSEPSAMRTVSIMQEAPTPTGVEQIADFANRTLDIREFGTLVTRIEERGSPALREWKSVSVIEFLDCFHKWLSNSKHDTDLKPVRRAKLCVTFQQVISLFDELNNQMASGGAPEAQADAFMIEFSDFLRTYKFKICAPVAITANEPSQVTANEQSHVNANEQSHVSANEQSNVTANEQSNGTANEQSNGTANEQSHWNSKFYKILQWLNDQIARIFNGIYEHALTLVINIAANVIVHQLFPGWMTLWMHV